MPHFDPNNSTCRVYTYRSGMLAAVGHDLELRVEDFRIEITEDRSSVQAELQAASLVPLHAVKGRDPQPGKLSDSDKRDIAKSVRDKVLEADRYPTIRFDSTSVEPTAGGYRIRGELGLHGTTRSIELSARSQDGQMVAETALHQPDFGIEPFRAFGGALKVKPDVVVQVSVPLSG